MVWVEGGKEYLPYIFPFWFHPTGYHCQGPLSEQGIQFHIFVNINILLLWEIAPPAIFEVLETFSQTTITDRPTTGWSCPGICSWGHFVRWDFPQQDICFNGAIEMFGKSHQPTTAERETEWDSCDSSDDATYSVMPALKRTTDITVCSCGRRQLVLFSNHSRSEPRTNHFLPKLHLSQTESREGHLFIDGSCGRQAVLQTVKAKGLVSLQDWIAGFPSQMKNRGTQERIIIQLMDKYSYWPLPLIM